MPATVDKAKSKLGRTTPVQRADARGKSNPPVLEYHDARKLHAELAKLRGEIRAQIAEWESRIDSLDESHAKKVLLPELHEKASGRIDAQKVAAFMAVPLKSLSNALGLNYKAVHRNPSAASFQKALRPVKRVLELLHEFFGPPSAIRAWLNTPHPDLNGSTSLETILEGKTEVVLLILENAWNGVPV